MNAGNRGDYKGPRIWFNAGFWWFRPPGSEESREISSVIRGARFRAANVAAELRIGSRTFRRLVGECLGVPPGKWLRIERAVAARHMLREGRPVKHVSHELGFRQQSEFCDEFRRWYGVSPMGFQRAQNEVRGHGD